MQKNKFWKFSCIFSTGPSLPKFYYITHLCKIELTPKIPFFFQFFQFKTMHLFPKSKLYIKNLFFWGTLCWSSSNNKRMGGGPMRQNLQKLPPSHSLTIWAISTKCTSKEPIFYVKFRFRKKMHSLKVKNLKKMEFSR